MIHDFNFIPVIKLPVGEDKENQDGRNNTNKENRSGTDNDRDCRGCKKRKASREFYRGQWKNDPERGTYRRTCQGCRLQLPAVCMATTADLSPPSENDGSALLGTFSRQVFRDLTNDPSRLIRERIFEHLRISSPYEFGYPNSSPLEPDQKSSLSSISNSYGTEEGCGAAPPATAAEEDRIRADELEHKMPEKRKESPVPAPPAQLLVTSKRLSTGRFTNYAIARETVPKGNGPQFERSSKQRWPSTLTSDFSVAPRARRPSDNGLHDPARSDCSSCIPRRPRVKSVP
ncbi:hypothetical protein MJO28_002099 [Puccinia striiformis f. sp. tritici]|uniref:Uncharacterized protein n=3 Tax=Puccinia striiformis TaxID=27350 RepID=A0A0L0W363_9BASI|nr:hypothetical protein Pst134EA_002669 [Puccinia striiformis f. sp. tritici]KAI9610112.1 hypothetical protein H4Q26_007111 [Puccinia striiformis f. sp. tritici PST-130]KNF05912.1 hypothetical protein PSTG_00904 [Puccinia striiformis f. sp. tritici PST-78]POW12588.1 hypothetical protein PSTT_04239 [Puccinia striiformis]KAH9464260.1 hypothetical protein Pst134EB_003791 [Puccinia striiformis f. sp. tritici]KAH9472041.1 hypothetical protein Pst134EA_002669 [Puccinia striiformis f. sp. tritici]